MLRTFSMVIFISTVMVIFTCMLFTHMHFVIFVMFNVLYRRRRYCHVGWMPVFSYSAMAMAVWHWARNGTERIPMLWARDATPLAEEITGSKTPISLALGSWRWGGEYGGGRDGDWEWKGGGWHIFYRRPVLTSITLAFFKSMCSAHSPCGIKRPTISKFWSIKWKKNI